MLMQQHMKQKWKDATEYLNFNLITNTLLQKILGMINPVGSLHFTIICINKDRLVILIRKY